MVGVKVDLNLQLTTTITFVVSAKKWEYGKFEAELGSSKAALEMDC